MADGTLHAAKTESYYTQGEKPLHTKPSSTITQFSYKIFTIPESIHDPILC